MKMVFFLWFQNITSILHLKSFRLKDISLMPSLLSIKTKKSRFLVSKSYITEIGALLDA